MSPRLKQYYTWYRHDGNLPINPASNKFPIVAIALNSGFHPNVGWGVMKEAI